jgi:hypothetical protein
MARSLSAEMSANTAVDAVPGTAIREQLARIVDSPKFIPSARLGKLYLSNLFLFEEHQKQKERCRWALISSSFILFLNSFSSF